MVVVSLETASAHTDNLEFHFRRMPAQHNLNLISTLTETLSCCWRRRMPGVVAKRLVRTRLREVSALSNAGASAILDISNPAQLSRCEFRVCALLNEGMTVNLIAESLSVCQATVRSHLSSIFAKTGTCSQIELLHQLNRLAEETRTKSV